MEYPSRSSSSELAEVARGKKKNKKEGDSEGVRVSPSPPHERRYNAPRVRGVNNLSLTRGAPMFRIEHDRRS